MERNFLSSLSMIWCDNSILTLLFLLMKMQLPCVTPYPGPWSVIVIDNCCTHKSQAVHEVIEAAGEFIEILK